MELKIFQQTHMTKKLFSGFLALLLLTAGWMSYSFRPIENSEICRTSNFTFQEGESLTYTIYYNWNVVWVPAGEVTFTIKESGDFYEIFASGKTFPGYNRFYKVNDYYYSRFEKESLLPRNFVRKLEEGKYRLYDSIAFDQKNRKAMTWHGRDKSSARFSVHHLDGCMHDLLSNIYMLRNLPEKAIQPGADIPIKVFFDKEAYPLTIKAGQRTTKEIKDLGTYHTIELQPQLVEGYVFKKGDVMNIWVSDDKNRIPLMVESPIIVGTIKAVLKSSSGLRHPMHSKI
jgi:hypothetical protein